MKSNQRTDVAKLAFKFVLTIGIVNLFADMTYEGARSITGPFLESLCECSRSWVDCRWR